MGDSWLKKYAIQQKSWGLELVNKLGLSFSQVMVKYAVKNIQSER
jgi:hypothetical protein